VWLRTLTLRKRAADGGYLAVHNHDRAGCNRCSRDGRFIDIISELQGCAGEAGVRWSCRGAERMAGPDLRIRPTIQERANVSREPLSTKARCELSTVPREFAVSKALADTTVQNRVRRVAAGKTIRSLFPGFRAGSILPASRGRRPLRCRGRNRRRPAQARGRRKPRARTVLREQVGSLVGRPSVSSRSGYGSLAEMYRCFDKTIYDCASSCKGFFRRADIFIPRFCLERQAIRSMRLRSPARTARRP